MKWAAFAISIWLQECFKDIRKSPTLILFNRLFSSRNTKKKLTACTPTFIAVLSVFIPAIINKVMFCDVCCSSVQHCEWRTVHWVFNFSSLIWSFDLRFLPLLQSRRFLTSQMSEATSAKKRSKIEVLWCEVSIVRGNRILLVPIQFSDGKTSAF